MCCSKGLIKRFVPFFLTFAVGLFIASFFITVAAPNFPKFEGRRSHKKYDREREAEIQRLREENSLLKNQQSTNDSLDTNYQELKFNMSVPPPPMPPAPPSYRQNSIPRN